MQRYDHFGDWLESLLNIREGGHSCTAYDDPMTRCFGFVASGIHHQVGLTVARNRPDWFRTSEDQVRVLNRMGLSVDDIMTRMRTPEGRASLMQGGQDAHA